MISFPVWFFIFFFFDWLFMLFVFVLLLFWEKNFWKNFWRKSIRREKKKKKIRFIMCYSLMYMKNSKHTRRDNWICVFNQLNVVCRAFSQISFSELLKVFCDTIIYWIFLFFYFFLSVVFVVFDYNDVLSFIAHGWLQY